MSCQYGDAMSRKTDGEILRGLREERGLSRQKVAGDLDISERTLIRHEDGTTPLTGFHRTTYASYYGVDAAVFDAKAAAA